MHTLEQKEGSREMSKGPHKYFHHEMMTRTSRVGLLCSMKASWKHLHRHTHRCVSKSPQVDNEYDPSQNITFSKQCSKQGKQINVPEL